MIALGTASVEQGAAAPLPCIHLKGSQLLPALALACPVATTTSATAGKFRLQLLPAEADAPSKRSTAELAAALHCRSHGRLVGTAVSVARHTSGAAEQAQQADEEGSLSSDAELDGAELDPPLAGLSEEEEAGAPEEAAADQAGVLQAWAPDALKPECWGLYEFELASGEQRAAGA